MKKLVIVIPVHNEAAVLPELHRRLDGMAARLPLSLEMLFVDDGSTDDSLAVIERLSAADTRISWLSLSRNFGKEAAVTAGLDHADGDAVVVLDADLQDPPELIPAMVAAFEDGCDVVYARRTSRRGESPARVLFAAAFYRLMHLIGSTRVPVDTGDFQLFSRRALCALRELREQNRYMKGLFAWIGYKQRELRYERDPRAAGSSKFNFWKLLNFATDAITSFSIAPLRIATFVGLCVSLVALGYGGYVFFKAVFFGDAVRGYPSLMVAILFLGGVQMFTIGIIGEYVGRIYVESKKRPVYLVDRQARAGGGADMRAA